MVMRGFALISPKRIENACGVADFAFGIVICHKKWPRPTPTKSRNLTIAALMRCMCF